MSSVVDTLDTWQGEWMDDWDGWWLKGSGKGGEGGEGSRRIVIIRKWL
jgi:hypothetical protein